MARQRKGETAHEFLDRCRLLAKRTVPCTIVPVLQRAYNEQAEQLLLSVFSKGMLGTVGKLIRYASLATVEEALRIAVTVSQAEIQEARDSAFYLDAEVADLTPAVQHTAARKSAEGTSQPRKPSRVSERQPKASTSKGQSDKPVKCYECSGYGHFARDCANRRHRQTVSNASPNAESRTGQRKVNEPRARQNKVYGLCSTKPALN